MKKFIFLLVLLAWQLSMAAPQSTDNSTNDDNPNATDAEPANSTAGVASDEPEVTDSDNEQSGSSDDAEESDSPARFIPTEQISQDLGVSFPVDI